MPKRIQRKRTKGWRMPAGTVYVGRPSRWGNRFIISSDPDRLEHYADWRKNVDLWDGWPCKDAETAVAAFRHFALRRLEGDPECFEPLRGKNLACWCRLDQPCHADVLLELANARVPEGSTPFPRTVELRLRTSDLAGPLYDAFAGCGTARGNQTSPRVPRHDSDTADGLRVRA